MIPANMPTLVVSWPGWPGEGPHPANLVQSGHMTPCQPFHVSQCFTTAMREGGD